MTRSRQSVGRLQGRIALARCAGMAPQEWPASGQRLGTGAAAGLPRFELAGTSRTVGSVDPQLAPAQAAPAGGRPWPARRRCSERVG